MPKRLTDRERVYRAITEAQWQRTVIDLAQAHGWRVAHFKPALVGNRMMTAVAADGAGFPDLVMARWGTVIFAELKRETGTVTDEQTAWLDALDPMDDGARHTVYVWRPSDQEQVEIILR